MSKERPKVRMTTWCMAVQKHNGPIMVSVEARSRQEAVERMEYAGYRVIKPKALYRMVSVLARDAGPVMHYENRRLSNSRPIEDQ